MEQTPIIADRIHLLSIEVPQQKVDTQSFKKHKQHQLNVGHKIFHNLKDERMKLELAISFEDNNKNQLSFFLFHFHFAVKNLSEFYTLNKDNIPVFNTLLIATLLGIGLSTSRGIIFEKLQNAGAGNVIIPIVAPQKIMGNP